MNRHSSRSRLVALLIVSLLIAGSAVAQSLNVWLGTSRNKLSKGIYHTTLNLKTGRLAPTRLAAEISGPGFLAQHPKLDVIYAVGALDGEAIVAAYRITGKAKDRLEPLNAMPIGDGGAAHVCVDHTGRTLITAQYGGGSVGVFALAGDGRIRERTQLIEHEGASGAVERRQKAPHPHWTGVSPDNRFAFIPDLGLDQVVVYRLDAKGSKLTAHGSVSLHQGAGPRHMRFHPNGRWAYVLNELDLTVTRCDYDAQTGKLVGREKVAAVPAAELAKEKAKSASEICVHPNGRFVYSANRGHDTITAYRVDEHTGALTVVEREFVRGATPRNFNLDPSGRWLLAGGQDSHTLAAFAVDSGTGELAYNRSVVTTPAPICVLFGRE